MNTFPLQHQPSAVSVMLFLLLSEQLRDSVTVRSDGDLDFVQIEDIQ